MGEQQNQPLSALVRCPSDSLQGLNKQFTPIYCGSQSTAAWRAARTSRRRAAGSQPTFRLISSQRIWDRGAAPTSTLHWFETELLTKEENLIGLMVLNGETLGQAESLDSSDGVVLDMDSGESHGEQEGSAYNGHFELVCYDPLFLFNSHGACLAAKLRSGNVHSAETWDELLWRSAFPLTIAWSRTSRRLVVPKRIDNWSLTSLQSGS